MKYACTFTLLLMLGACGDKTPVTAGDASKPALPAVAPAIIPPGEVADPTEPPSYEVAIAGAAAERNNANQRCAAQPESVRVQCEQEANAAFSDSQTDLDRLRGNTQ